MSKNIGRPRNPKSVNYQLITGLFGEYISQKDMTKKQLKQYKSCLKVYGN